MLFTEATESVQMAVMRAIDAQGISAVRL